MTETQNSRLLWTPIWQGPTSWETAFRAPNTNPYVERFIQTIQQECLDHFVIIGQQHFLTT